MSPRIGGESGASRTLQLLRDRVEEQRKSFKRLSSGERIGEAGDDPVGIALAERMRAQLRSLTESSRGARMGVDLARRADGALQETGDHLARMRELAVRSASETLSTEDRAVLDEEFQALRAEVDASAETTEFNGRGLLDGTLGASVPVGTDGVEVAEAPTVDASAAGLGVDALSVADATDAGDALEVIDDAIATVSSVRGEFGAFESQLYAYQRSAGIERENLADAESRITGLDVALESARMAAESLLSDLGVASLVHANVSPTRALMLI